MCFTTGSSPSIRAFANYLGVTNDFMHTTTTNHKIGQLSAYIKCVKPVAFLILINDLYRQTRIGMHSPLSSGNHGVQIGSSVPSQNSSSGCVPGSTLSTSLTQQTSWNPRISHGHQDKSRSQIIVGRPSIQGAPLSPNSVSPVFPTVSATSVRNVSSVLQKNQARCGNYQQSPIMKRQNMILRPTNTSIGGASSPGNSGGTCSTSTNCGSAAGGVACGPVVTLDSIVTEYLRKQHALCKNPVVTCPPFDLFM